jgi:chaperonin GroEL
MAAKQLLFNEEARRKLQAGAAKLARTVKSTLGPGGHSVLYKKSFGGPQVTNDGVTVSKEIELPDPFENMGAKLVNEVCSKTNDVAGDGTTTACVLAEAILDEGMKVVAAGVNPIELKRGIDKATEAAIAHIRSMSKDVSGRKEIEQVGTISARYDATIGKIFADAIEKVGKEGVITVEEGKTTETTLEHVQGYQFDKGYISPYFVTNSAQMVAEFEDPYILLYNKKISNLREFLPLLEKVAQTGKALIVIAEDVESEALTTLVINKLQGILKIAAVKAPGFGDRRKAMLEDMAALTGGTAVTEDLGIKLDDLELDQLGTAKKVSIEKEHTTIIEGGGDKSAVDARAKAIRTQIDKTTSNYDREKLEERLAKLTGGVALINVGAKTESEMKELKMRVDDALHATQAAAEEGIVAGGGTAFLRAIAALDKVETTGGRAPRRAHHPQRAASADPADCRQRRRRRQCCRRRRAGRFEPEFGYNARTAEYGDIVEMGVIDPTKVVCTALTNASSVVGLILTSNSIVTEVKDDKEAVTGATA